MLRFLLTLILSAVLSGNALAQSVTLPAEVKGAVGTWIIVAPEKVDGGKPRWRIDAGLQEVRLDLLLPPETLANLRGKVVTAQKPGRYKLEAWNAKADVASEIATCWVVIGDVPPGPGPDPGPKPDPKPDPAPIPVDGFRVLIVYENADAIPASQSLILTAQEVRQYLNAKCVMGAANKEWRVWDKDVDTSGETKLWQDAMKRPRASVPWIIISDGKTGFEGPLPKTVAETLTLLRKYGGQ